MMADAPKTDTEKKAEVKEVKDALDRAEAKTEPGAPTRTPKARLLDASALAEKNPDKHYRYGTLSNPDKLEMRQHDGFERVNKKEAEDAEVRDEVGKMVLLEQPKHLHDERVAREQAENKRRMESHKRDAQAVAENIARELRDKHGIEVSADRFFVND